MRTLKNLKDNYLFFSVKTYEFISKKHVGASLGFVILFVILSNSDASAAGFNDKKYKDVCSKVLLLAEGSFGSMLSALAGIGALIASAAGGFKMAWSLVVVSVGCFVLRTYQELWFASCGQ